MKRKTKIDFIASLLVLLFVYAAISKLLDFHHFALFLGKIKLFAPFALQLAWMLPLVELIVSALLIIKQTRLTAFYASFFLMLSFIAYLSVTLAFGKKIPCTCGGILQGLKWGPHIVFNSFFLLLSYFGINLQLKEQADYSRERWSVKYEAGQAENL